MSRSPAGLARDALAHYFQQQAHVGRFCVAYSGGRDSHVLLHLAAELLAHRHDVALRALHVDHGLTHDSVLWAAHAAVVAESLGVELVTRHVEVSEDGDGPEAAARAARQAVFTEELNTGEHLLIAQHASDQAETFLLQALRGSGPDGLGSIPRRRAFAAGFMARPLLGCPEDALAAVAEQAGLAWVEDPSNADVSLDRNFLRHEIIPLLERRWPAAVRTLGRSAHRSAAASQTLLTLARDDLAEVRAGDSSELSCAALLDMPRERAYNTLRLWVRQAGHRLPRLQVLVELFRTLLGSAESSAGLVSARDYEFRRYRDKLYLLAPQGEPPDFSLVWTAPYDDLLIPETGYVLSREACERQDIVLPTWGSITVSNRDGGEQIQVGDPPFHKSVKHLLQEKGVPPWERRRLPLLYADGKLVAVWNLAVANEFRVGGARE